MEDHVGEGLVVDALFVRQIVFERHAERRIGVQAYP